MIEIALKIIFILALYIVIVGVTYRLTLFCDHLLGEDKNKDVVRVISMLFPIALICILGMFVFYGLMKYLRWVENIGKGE